MGLDVLDHAHQRQLVEQIGRPQRDAIEQVLDPPQIRGARAPDDAGDFVALLEEQLREIRPVLPGDSGDDRALSHDTVILRRERAASRAIAAAHPATAASRTL